MKTVILRLLVMFTLMGISCGRKTNSLVAASGKVICEGLPASGATVYFHRQGIDPVSEQITMGVVRDDGTFEVVCGSLGKGIAPGEYRVTIEWKQVTGQTKGRPRRGPDKLHGRYSDPRHARFQVTIKPERTELVPFVVTES